MASFTTKIPIKFPSLNEYVRACRGSKGWSSSMKRSLEKETAVYLEWLPSFETPIRIHFLWIEENQRRDYDNVAFAKKFILDALQKSGKLPNDNRKWVKGFSDDFTQGEEAGVEITITEE